MDFSHKEDTSSYAIDDGGVNIKEIIFKYLKYWFWFLLSVVVVLIFSLYKLNFTRPQYRAVATIKIKDEEQGDKSKLSAFQDLSVLAGSNEKIEDQIEILKSKSLISEVIRSLGLNIQLYTQKNSLSKFIDENLNGETEYYEVENYLTPPLNLNFLVSDSIVNVTGKTFKIYVNSNNKFTYIDDDNEIQKSYSFGEKVSTSFGDIIITPNVDLKKSMLFNTNILVKILPVKNLARYYSNGISIEPVSDFSSVLALTIDDGVIKKAEDFLNELVKKYNDRAINYKEELTQSTSDFVTKRLEIISNELSDVDLTAESLKTRYRVSDAASEIGFNIQSGQEIENQIVQANAQLKKIEYLKDYVSNTNEFIPSNIGIGDNNVENISKQYNDLMLQKKKLLENSTEKNPIVVNINEQLKGLRENINAGLNNLETSQQISIDALNQQDARINSKLYSAPRQERKIRDIKRQQQIKEALYLYLLQKREETAITLGIADPDAEIIDMAEGYGPISPKKHLFYFSSLLIGLFIPFVIIYIKDFLDTKVKTRDEVEKFLNIPILGDIPRLTNKKRFLISKDDHSSIAEAFRILRTNLNFVLPTENEEEGKVVFVTSSIAHEGKSLISSNLAASLAMANKKTLLLGMDIRAPKIKEYLGIRGNIGVTNYIVNRKLDVDDITLTVPKIENLNLISSGDIPPNPADLLLNNRIADLFAKVKKEYDYIIVDTAASSIITDTMIIKDYADAFLYVIRLNHIDKRQLNYVKSIYQNKRFKNLVLVVNEVEHKKGYGYGYGYGVNFEKSKKKKWWQLSGA